MTERPAKKWFVVWQGKNIAFNHCSMSVFCEAAELPSNLKIGYELRTRT